MPFVQTADRTALFYKDAGSGRPVVFVASWGLCSDMWDYQVVDLASRDLRCITYDRRGHGRSDAPERGHDYDTFAGDLATLLEHLDLRDVTLVGHSMGGAQVVRYLTRHGSERVSGIVLVAPTTPFLLKTPDNPRGLDATLLDELVYTPLMRDRPKWLADNARPFFVAKTSAAMTHWVMQLMLQPSLRTMVDEARMRDRADFRDELRAITVPALIVHGDADVSVPIEFGRMTAQLVPNCALSEYAAAPHGLFITHAQRLNDDIHAFARASLRRETIPSVRRQG